jgi:HTH-type transcriptional repressor of NAD biosynthesis genes
MTKAYVLMTAMPPTKGHLHLIQFAARLAGDVEVIVATQPGEPFEYERVMALREAVQGKYGRVSINHIRKTLPQEPNPEAEAEFWDMWAEFLRQFGIQPGDYIVASEAYGIKLAEITGAVFMPYDMERSISYTKATDVRRDPTENFEDILPEFQPLLRKRITIFGAESTGKTTLSRELALGLGGHWAFEWARPYLESVGAEITQKKMVTIWKGQKALQEQVQLMQDKAFIFQDTDLFSTLGYWQYSQWAALEHHPVPINLLGDAMDSQSDLYLITKSNIPFEHDQLRYGGDHREIPDKTWIDMCDRYGLNYHVLESDDRIERLQEAEEVINKLVQTEVTNKLAYQREGKEYESV